MKNFIKTLLASTLGVIIGSTILFFLSMLIFFSIVTMGSSSTYDLKDKTILELELKGNLFERENSSPFDALMGDKNFGLDDVLESIKKAKDNDKIKGIYIKTDHFSSGVASLEPIRKALIDFKESGKFIVAYGDIYGQGSYYLSSVADKIIMNPEGALDFRGLNADMQFVKNFYDKIGIKPQIFKVGTFKSAVEPLIQEKMSDANRLQTSAFINDIWSHWLNAISKSRNISVENLNKYADQCLAFSEADSIVKYNMIDTLMYETQVESYLKDLVQIKEKDKLRLASIKNMANVKSNIKEDKKNQIAVLYAEGKIVSDADEGAMSLMNNVISSKEYVKELQKLKEDETIKAVVFRVNSGGGSAYASEQIWKAVKDLNAVKPVIVSMGDNAASGGYYIAAAANTIVAEPTTLTGSIGIFGVFPDGTELAKKLGYTFDGVKTNEHSDFGGKGFGIPFLISASSRGLNEKESLMFQKHIESGYDLFLSRCAEGRSKTKAEIDSIGQGRVWTGNQALKIGLVDKLGGLDEAIKIAAEKANLETYSTAKYPKIKDFFTQLTEESMKNSKAKILKIFMGETQYEQNILMKQLNNMDMRMAIIPERINY